MTDAVPQHAKHIIDATAGIITLGALLDYAPKVAAVFAILWYIVVLSEKAYAFYKSKKQK